MLAVLCYSNFTFAQQKADSVYERIFCEFVRFYNSNKPDSLDKLLNGYIIKELGNKKRAPDSVLMKNNLKKMHEGWGKILGFTYVGPYDNDTDTHGNVMVYFKVIFDKKANLGDGYGKFNGRNVHAAAITLNNENIIMGYRIFTNRKNTDSLIARY